MRYTKTALLIFGAGALLGLVIVVVEIDWLGRLASSLMALGLAAVPFGMIVDWRLATKSARAKPKRRGSTPTRRAAPQPRRNPRPRKPAPPKR